MHASWLQPGIWRYRIENSDETSQQVAVTVSSKSRDPGKPIITVQAFWGIRDMQGVVPAPESHLQRIYAVVSKGWPSF